MIKLKSKEEIDQMRKAGRVVAEILGSIGRVIEPGMRTKELEEVAQRIFERRGVLPAFKGYRGFPSLICVSVNEEVIHGIPGERVLREGDIVSVDVGVVYNGYYGDGAMTFGVGEISGEALRLIETAKGALELAISVAKEGVRVGDISHAIQSYVEERGVSVIREYAGHGIGRELHEEPPVPNYGYPGEGPVLMSGMTIAIEPMITSGDWRTKVLPDGWTVVTIDGSLSAHFEHTILIKEGEAEVLTKL